MTSGVRDLQSLGGARLGRPIVQGGPKGVEERVGIRVVSREEKLLEIRGAMEADSCECGENGRGMEGEVDSSTDRKYRLLVVSEVRAFAAVFEARWPWVTIVMGMGVGVKYGSSCNDVVITQLQYCQAF